MCDRIVAFDKQLCDHTFLSELGPVLPTPQQVGRPIAHCSRLIFAQVSLLKQQSAETPEELQMIHPADRLMIRLIKIPHLADRLAGMLYMVNFEETSTLLESVSVWVNPSTLLTPIIGGGPVTNCLRRPSQCQQVQRLAECHLDDGQFYERQQLRRRCIRVQDWKYQ